MQTKAIRDTYYLWSEIVDTITPSATHRIKIGIGNKVTFKPIVFFLFLAINTIATPMMFAANVTDPVIASPASAEEHAQLHGMVTTAAVTEGGLRGVCVRTINLTTGSFRTESTIGIKSDVEGFDGQHAWSKDSGGRVRQDESEVAQTHAINEAYRNSRAYWFPSRAAAESHSIGQRKEGPNTLMFSRSTLSRVANSNYGLTPVPTFSSA